MRSSSCRMDQWLPPIENPSPSPPTRRHGGRPGSGSRGRETGASARGEVAAMGVDEVGEAARSSRSRPWSRSIPGGTAGAPARGRSGQDREVRRSPAPGRVVRGEPSCEGRAWLPGRGKGGCGHGFRKDWLFWGPRQALAPTRLRSTRLFTPTTSRSLEVSPRSGHARDVRRA